MQDEKLRASKQFTVCVCDCEREWKTAADSIILSKLFFNFFLYLLLDVFIDTGVEN